MDEHADYRVLAPDSVAWYIQAALVADRTGNETARDLALREAQRVAEERRLVPAPDGSRVLCYDCRTTGERLEELEALMEETNGTLSVLAARASNNEDALLVRLDTIERRLATLEAMRDELHAAGVIGPDAWPQAGA